MIALFACQVSSGQVVGRGSSRIGIGGIGARGFFYNKCLYISRNVCKKRDGGLIRKQHEKKPPSLRRTPCCLGSLPYVGNNNKLKCHVTCRLGRACGGTSISVLCGRVLR